METECLLPRSQKPAICFYPEPSECSPVPIPLFVMQSSPLPCYLVPLRPKYLPEHPILDHPTLCFSVNIRDQALQASHDYIN